MKNTPSPPPRSLSLQTSLIVQFSHIYTPGGWLSTGVGSGLIWTIYTLSNSSYSQNLSNEFMGYLVAGIFLILGLFSLRISLREGRRFARLLKKGEVTYGKLVKSEDELASMMDGLSKVKFVDDLIKDKAKKMGAKEGDLEAYLKQSMEDRKSTQADQVIMDYVFEFQTKQGSTHTVKHKVKYIDGEELEDEPKELILYDPANPDKAVVYDAIKNAPKIDGHGNFIPTASSKLYVLILPSVVILINVWFLFKNFPHLFS